MKEDVGPAPDRPPAKRRQLEQAPAVWLAVWASDERLPPSQRKRAQDERDRRKALSPDKRLGLLVGQEGMTPEQLAVVREALAAAGATEIHHPGVASNVHQACKATGVAVHNHRDVRSAEESLRAVVRSADVIIATPKEANARQGEQAGVWGAVRLAKHRSLPVRVILPGGDDERP